MTRIEQRTKDIIEGYKGLPGEFMMLKGILCLAHTVEDAQAKRHGWEAGSIARKEIKALIDGVMIAARMDEISAAEIAAVLRVAA